MTRAGILPSSRSPVDARSFLFVPGDRPDRFDKALASGADEVILDLEDAVPPQDLQSARLHVAAWLQEKGAGCVRINSPSSAAYEADCAALAGLSSLRAVIVSKVDHPDDVIAAGAALGPGVPLIALIESAIGIRHAYDIAAVPGVVRLAFGSIDYALDTGVADDELALLYARSTLVVASRAARLSAPIDGVTNALDDDAVVAENARMSRRLGFSGKLCVHPRQAAPVNTAFAPTEEEIRWAERIRADSTEGTGSTRVDGQMVDKPVLERALRILREAGSLAIRTASQS